VLLVIGTANHLKTSVTDEQDAVKITLPPLQITELSAVIIGEVFSGFTLIANVFEVIVHPSSVAVTLYV
jgi:hypothetical protein